MQPMDSSNDALLIDLQVFKYHFEYRWISLEVPLLGSVISVDMLLGRTTH